MTSIEFLPLDSVAAALRKMAPNVKMLTGDGAQLVPQATTNNSQTRSHLCFNTAGIGRSIHCSLNDAGLAPQVLGAMTPHEQRRTMVIFDGEKRFRAWSTWEKVFPASSWHTMQPHIFIHQYD